MPFLKAPAADPLAEAERMPIIGAFSAVKDGYAGTIRTLTMSVRVRRVANDRKDAW